MILNEIVAADLRQRLSRLIAGNKILSKNQLSRYHSDFQKRFGPDALSSRDGTDLLEFMHDHTNRDSLVYWLEFKNDEELPTKRFGSIAGGSALKFGIYRRKETGAWTAGSALDQKELSTSEAVAVARRHRDAFLRGCDSLSSLPAEASDDDYLRLQAAMTRDAYAVSDTAWGHKYFMMNFPSKIDNYHNPDYQRFHLARLLQHPPGGAGRYVVAGRFVAIASELDVALNQLCEVINDRHGGGHTRQYWRFAVSNQSHWEFMREFECAAIAWGELGDLTGIDRNRQSRDELRKRLAHSYPSIDGAVVQKTSDEIFRFLKAVEPNDIVVAMDGPHVMAIGQVIGADVVHDPQATFPYQRRVRWLALHPWDFSPIPKPSVFLAQIKNDPAKGAFDDQIAIERQLLGHAVDATLTISNVVAFPRAPALDGITGRIQSILERKGQVILYGPPGTGKTFWAWRAARELASSRAFGKNYSSLAESEAKEIDDASDGLVRICCFHPSYGYEDFIEGYRPRAEAGRLTYMLTDGLIKRICTSAARQTNRDFFLIVDEINRGDIPRIFGELLTILEKDKRGQKIQLPFSGSFTVPPNVFLIGTMNTADRSIALLDTALRRRFGFIELMPDYSLLATMVEEISVGALLEAINEKIREHVGRDVRNLQIGHAYFLPGGKPPSDARALVRIFRDDVIPLLEEYCYENFSILEKILGPEIVDAKTQSIRTELFEDGRHVEFVQTLATIFPDLLTSPLQTVAETSAEFENEFGDEDE